MPTRDSVVEPAVTTQDADRDGRPFAVTAPLGIKEKSMKLACAWMLALALLGSAAAADDIRQIPLAANDLVYDAVTQRLYASVPGTGGNIGNSIVAIDPASGTLLSSTFIGSEPGKL